MKRVTDHLERTEREERQCVNEPRAMSFGMEWACLQIVVGIVLVRV